MVQPRKVHEVIDTARKLSAAESDLVRLRFIESSPTRGGYEELVTSLVGKLSMTTLEELVGEMEEALQVEISALTQDVQRLAGQLP